MHTYTQIRTRIHSLWLSFSFFSPIHTRWRAYMNGSETSSRIQDYDGQVTDKWCQLWCQSSSQWQVMSIAPVLTFYHLACLCLTLKSSPWAWSFLKSNNTCQPVSVNLTSSVCLWVYPCACVCLSVWFSWSHTIPVNLCLSASQVPCVYLQESASVRAWLCLLVCILVLVCAWVFKPYLSTCAWVFTPYLSTCGRLPDMFHVSISLPLCMRVFVYLCLFLF